ncbi:hypothetical protein FSARC_3647 [Fusarium sarcochroum]|uniref:Uncharacterized protein n=1 Tax=Fusarium sarcochroum TaxID=1208366 RepID=A0A8H4U3V8_9HYPO|nr:hypothetical protein FSARC_3647 [Fusarium sarcochroum]
MSDSMDTTSPSDPVGSATATAPKKPSLRILEGGTAGLSTREDDLAHGPSLLGLGDGHEYVQGPSVSRLASDLEFEALGHHDPETSILPSFPLELPAPVPPQTMSLSEVSQSGASLSLPADTLSSTGISRAEEQTRLPATNVRDASLFPWKYEFSWEGSHLCFDGEPLELVKTHQGRYSEADPGSEIALSTSLAPLPRLQTRSPATNEFEPFDIAGIGSFDDRAVGQLFPDLEIASAVCSISSDGSRSDTVEWDELIPPASDPDLSIEMDKKVDWMVDLLIDDYHRSYAPQRSQRRSDVAHNKIANHGLGNASTKIQGTSKSTRGRKGPPRRKAAHGAEDSEDEDDRGGEEGPSSAKKASNSRRFACPFLRWNPQKHGRTDIHMEPDCPDCHMRYPVEPHDCGRFPAVLPIEFITDEKLKAIKERAKRSQTHEEQWQHIYGVLFPDAPRCFSPYLDDREEEELGDAERYFRSPYAQMVLREEMKVMEFDAEMRVKILELVYARFLPGLWPNGGVYPHMSDDKGQPPSLTQPSQTVDPRNISTLAPSMLGLSMDESKIEDTASSALLNATSIEDFTSATETEGLGFYENDAFGTPQDGNFTYPTWLEGRETYDMSLDLTLEELIQE